jgi:hypothetical protein
MSEHEDSCLCCQCMQDQRNALEVENDQLRARVRELEETQRWRKWPHEKPTETGCHMVRLPGKCFTMTGYWNCFEEWDLKYERFYWMPQIPLPGGE